MYSDSLLQSRKIPPSRLQNKSTHTQIPVEGLRVRI